MPIDELFATMQDGVACTDSSALEVTGVAPELEQKMSSIFVPPFLNSDVRFVAQRTAKRTRLVHVGIALHPVCVSARARLKGLALRWLPRRDVGSSSVTEWRACRARSMARARKP